MQKLFGVQSPLVGAGQSVGSGWAPVPPGYVQAFVQMRLPWSFSQRSKVPVQLLCAAAVVHAVP